MMYNVRDDYYDVDEWFETIEEAIDYAKRLYTEWCDYNLVITSEDGREWCYY